jgi:hypothetical protein
MKVPVAGRLAALGAFVLWPQLGIAQDITAPKDVLDKLKQQPTGEMRKATVVPATSAGNAGSPAIVSDAGKLRSVQTLLEQVEEIRGAQVGTIRATSAKGATINLRHDLTKARANFSLITEAPFGSALSDTNISSENLIANTPATVEYRAKNSADAVEKVVSIKSKNSVAANAFSSGPQPVTLKVQNANLVASQVSTSEPEPRVKVQVGDETRELKVGEVSQFGAFEVRILASANRSAKKTYEGLPYVLRLQVMPLQ